MIDVIEVLKKNEKEASRILADEVNGGVLTFAHWDENEEVYSNADDCPYIRYANDDGEITSMLVVAAIYDEYKERIEIITTDDEYKKTDDKWFPLNYADDISYWQVLEAIGNYEDYENQ